MRMQKIPPLLVAFVFMAQIARGWQVPNMSRWKVVQKYDGGLFNDA